MIDIGNIPINLIKIPSSNDSSSAIGILNPEMSNMNTLEINQSIVNLIVLSDNYWTSDSIRGWINCVFEKDVQLLFL